ncbi:hypothetical protein JCM6882_002384 [Rhodosporidiobolus microsporus]
MAPSTTHKKQQPPQPSEPKEPSLSVTKPHVAPDQAVKAKTKRSKSSASNKRKAAAKEFAIERAQKLVKRKDEVDGKRDKKKKARQLWS